MVNLTDAMNQFSELLSESNESSACELGCSESDFEATMNEYKRRDSRKPICAIRDWIWVDFIVTESEDEVIREVGFIPAGVYSPNVIFDEAGRCGRGENVRSTALVSVEGNCICTTKNTAYILVGKGKRTDMDTKLFLSIYF